MYRYLLSFQIKCSFVTEIHGTEKKYVRESILEAF